MRTVNVLWTGGWDSTYRVLTLLRDGHCWIQPHYLINPRRQSHHLEMRAMAEISDQANERYWDRLLPPKMVRVDEIAITPEARNRHACLVKAFGIGPQYLWLSEYVAQSGIERLELCIHTDDKAYAAVRFGKDELPGEPGAISEAVEGLLLSRFSMPILGSSKIEMKGRAQALGFDDLMEMTWFCQEPTQSGRPCGFCRPCQWTIAEGLAYRVPLDRRLRAAIDRSVIRRLPSYRLRRILSKRLSGGR